ncbi:hypothetical protein LAZ67_2002715 [Cordylochernes scorpioides]|uniref:Reverse transcriptase Ty1/copia-type domain-containing protein n=1 Tax=Cordylochernes scorpioides TaxID=51811 RepID=A0ABY6K3D0_9ARAC|nr:hypothetical protein LAZ67_2002715 [Cordylochernes scorpioides]
MTQKLSRWVPHRVERKAARTASEETIPETSEEVENHDDHSHSDLENQDEHSELPYNLRPNLKDKLYYELSSDDEPIEDNEGKDPTYDPTVGALKLSHGNLLPSSYEEAINHPDSPLWHQAMNKEIHSLHNHHVWDLTELPEGAKAIKSKWIFSKKMDPQTNQEIYKARLVALGCSQEYGTDYTETFSPVMKTDSFRTLLAYATMTMAGYEFHHFDVETAFLYGKLSETIYMTQPPGYQDDKKKTSESEERIKTEGSAKPQPGATIGRDASADPVVLNPNIDIPKYDGTEDPRPWIESLEEIGFL